MAGWIREYGNVEGSNTRHYMMSSDYDGTLPDDKKCEIGSDITVVDTTAHAETGYKRFDGTNWNVVGG